MAKLYFSILLSLIPVVITPTLSASGELNGCQHEIYPPESNNPGNKYIVTSSVGSRFRFVPKLVQRSVGIALEFLYSRLGFYRPQSKFAIERGAEFQKRIAAGETLYLVGIGPASHNSGVSLVRVSTASGIEILSNDEEERFTACKHCSDFPLLSLEVLKSRLNKLNIGTEQIFAFLGSWDYVSMFSLGSRMWLENFPQSLMLANPRSSPDFVFDVSLKVGKASKNLAKALGSKQPLPIIAQTHHDNHAYLAYAISPFANNGKVTMVSVLDGFGDTGAISLYRSNQHGSLDLQRRNDSCFDSLGCLYSVVSSTQGGWSTLSSDGRYMGAAGWGNQNRLTNPYYSRLRQIIHFGNDGSIQINRKLANWHQAGLLKPYKEKLSEIIGDPIALDQLWNPDAVLNVEAIEHSPITQDRVDKAAALQLVFEDGLFHIVDYLIRSNNGADQLVLSGGTALNCVANLHLLEHFNKDYYRRYFRKETTLKIWVPPFPGDAGTPIGAAFSFAMKNGARATGPLVHPFLNGLPAETSEIEATFNADDRFETKYIGNTSEAVARVRIAETMASIVADDGIIGIYQGASETGPRALGHRSILANPANRMTRSNLNSRVKYREAVRPLAPMVTLETAHELFHLEEGASAANYNAYDYMIIAARAKEVAKLEMPAIVHIDGTSRIQIVREEQNPLIYEYLQAMKVHIGHAISVNTSLNVGTPIVHSPSQALDALSRAKDMDGLIVVSANGRAYAVWKKPDSGQASHSKLAIAFSESPQL